MKVRPAAALAPYFTAAVAGAAVVARLGLRAGEAREGQREEDDGQRFVSWALQLGFES